MSRACSLFLILLWSFSAESLPREGREISFDEAVEIALQNNFELKALRLQNNSLREKARQALAPNSPTLSLSKNDLPALDPNATAANQQITLSYTLGFPGKAFSQSASFRHLSEASRDDALGKEIELVALIFNNVYGQLANEELEKILTTEIQKAKDLIKLQETRYSLGQGMQADILNAKVALSKLQQDELNNKNDRLALENDFMSLLGHPEEGAVRPAPVGDQFIPSSIPEMDALLKIMLKNRPSIHSAAHSVDASDSLVSAAKLQALPDFQLSAGMNDYKIPASAPVQGMTRDYNLGISVTIPLFFPINELAGIRAARADREANRAKLDMVRASARSELISTYTNFMSNRFSMEQLMQLVIPAAKASYELTLSTYARGKIDYLRLADARSTFIQVEKDLSAKRKQLAQSFYQLIQIVGCDFTKPEGAHACE